jgi:hypothetical protein
MPDLGLITRSDLAESLGVSERTLRRRLAGLDIPVILRTKYRLSDLDRIIECLSTSGSGAKSGTRAARSASARRASPSLPSPQDAARAAMRRLLPQRKRRESVPSSSKAPPGGRDAQP